MEDSFEHAPKPMTVWTRIIWSMLAVVFAILGVSQIASGRASGEHGFPVDRHTEPVVFWIYIATYFVISGWILVALAKSRSSKK